ncbi:hypothetical protein LOTGIDRAFT_235019 [Lottia gigantea]|uniref:chitin synthase n=1 Tax=Lottia gigantea TaxID=225164 RepID=V3Z9E0_LOTGI|nr:hypothetical protein LOTGIDRAFT_235019 [Lottia gigantea]ESO87528.1 hypothetical protein LOTGIDRAFT_235019 [Lottia gigantea]
MFRKVPQSLPSLGNVDDISQLETIDNEILLDCIKQRFEQNSFYQHEIYTNIRDRSSQPAHIFWAADFAYRALKDGNGQCLVVTGDSGAGKTESTKLILKHLIHLNKSPSKEHDLIAKLEKINQVLEFFGNAETSLNENSSRFGKLVEISYTDNNTIEFAKIEGYILEKFRVTEPNENEKNFHAFYALFAGMSDCELRELELEELSEYRILTTFNKVEEERSYERKYNEMINILDEVGLNKETRDQIHSILAAILHLTNIEFDEDPSGAIGFLDVKALESIDRFGRMLNLEEEDFDNIRRLLLSTEIRDEKRLKTLSDAEDGRDALARELYSCLFYGIIDVINSILANNHLDKSSNKKKSIRILDISGFENLEKNNSFEQLLINTVNENLQQYFLRQAFKEEEREFLSEGVRFDSVQYRDNTDVISLLCRPPVGIIHILNDSVSVNPSVRHFIQHVQQIHHQNPNFSIIKGNQRSQHTMFSINHYASEVIYDASNFLKKNRDTVSAQLSEIVQRSDNMFIRNYFQLGSFATTSRNRGGRSSFRGRESICSESSNSSRTGKLVGRVSDSFQKSLKRMMDKVQTLPPLFIRCIKPNPKLQPSKFDGELVRQQLERSGIMDAAKVRCSGYPVRMFFKDFVKRYSILQNTETPRSTPKSDCENILNSLKIFDYGIGKTKVFLKMKHRDKLEDQVVEKEKLKEKEKRDTEARRREEAKELAIRQASSMNQDSESTRDAFTAPQDGSDSGLSSNSDLYNPYMNQETLNDSMGKGFMPSLKEGLEDNKSVIDEYDDNENITDQLNTETEKDTDKNASKSTKSEKDSSKTEAWETMCITERDCENSNEFEDSVRRIVRCVMYIFLLVFVCGSCSVSKLSMYWISKSVIVTSKSQPHRNKLFIQLIWCITVPMIYKWCLTMFKALFATSNKPSKKAIFVLTVVDVFQTCGRCVMILLVMPYLSPIETTLCTLSVGLLPAILNIHNEFTARAKPKSEAIDPVLEKELNISTHVPGRRRFIYVIFVSFLVFLVQLGSPFAVIFTGTFSQLPSKGDNSQLRLGALFCLVCFCVTVTWWENFAFGKLKCCNFDLNEVRKNLRRVRTTGYIYSAPIQIVLSGLFMHFLLDNDMEDSFNYYWKSFSSMFFIKKKILEHFKEFGLMYIQMISTNMCVYCSGIACRLHMQQLGFALPIVIVPIVFTALGSLCFPVEWYTIPNSCLKFAAPQGQADWITIGLTIGVYLSYLFLTRHIWQPKAERMAKIEKLFSFGHSDPVFPDVSLALKRRQDKAENIEYKKKKQTFKQPMVYICATMWHEIQQEMLQLLKSLFRLDFDICKRYLAQKKFETNIEDLYTAEIHIIFDDAFETDEKTKQRMMNGYVRQLIQVMPMACSSVSKGSVVLKPVKKITTPYGGRLEWIMPGGTKMEVHLKDKNKIRHKKRWSQIMYMYYLLGHKLLKNYQTSDDLLREAKGRAPSASGVRPYSSLLNKLPATVVEEAANTFIMALDGDVDFGPESVRLLIDRMKKNRDVAAVCGRIHPIGQGPMVWYQQFEYSVGHWLQKATENVLGCVLCCPGCFSLFRGLSLMDDNVMRLYAIDATEAKHFIQYEQGEDRWLCTLLLQQGYKIDYCAGSDAFTYAPETFHDFYIQRRRWSPSTMANVMDLLGSWKTTIKMNNNISTPFMFYQFILMASSILAPGTVSFMIAGSYTAVLNFNAWQSYLLSVLPILAFILLCLKAKTETQVAVAAVLSSVYAIVMVIVSVGTVINIVQEDFYTPNVLFLVGLSAIFVITALIHPKELMCLIHGILYYLTVPSTFVFLTVFFLCNLNIVSWGTREAPKKTDDDDELGMPVQKPPEKSKFRKFIDSIGIPSIFDELSNFIRQTLGKEAEPKSSSSTPNQMESGLTTTVPSGQCTPAVKKKVPRKPKVKWVELPDSWKSAECIKDGIEGELSENETIFWQKLLTKFLLPIKENKERQEQIASDLKSIRNNVVFAYFLVNLMFTLVILQLDLKEDLLRDQFFIVGKYEPVSVLFLGVFAALILTQFIAMLIHRWGTFLLLISNTTIDWCSSYNTNDTATALKEIEEMQKGEQEVIFRDDSESDSEYPALDIDYSDNEDDESEQTDEPISQYEKIVTKEHKRRRKSMVAGMEDFQPSAWVATSQRNNRSIAVRNLYRRTSISPLSQQFGESEHNYTRGRYNRKSTVHRQFNPPSTSNYTRRYTPKSSSVFHNASYKPDFPETIPECDYD